MSACTRLKSILPLALLISVTSCGIQSCDEWNNAPRTEYYIQGSDIAFRPATALDQPSAEFVRSLFNNRTLYMGLWRVNADDSDERYKIDPAWVTGDSQFASYGGSRVEPAEYQFGGQLDVHGSQVEFDLEISTPNPHYTNLSATGTAGYDDLQRLIKQVRLPAWSDNTSTDTAEVAWELSGEYDGVPFSAGFSQVFHGRSRYPMYPYY